MNVQASRSFLGLLNYYAKFLPNIASILHPLNSLLQQPPTTSYNPSLLTKLAADASAYAIGAVISHILPDESAYDKDMEFKSTHKHNNADGLSSLPLQTVKEATSTELSIFNIAQIEFLPVTAEQIQSVTRNDPVLSKVLIYTRRGWPHQVPDIMNPYSKQAQEITVEGELMSAMGNLSYYSKEAPRSLLTRTTS